MNSNTQVSDQSLNNTINQDASKMEFIKPSFNTVQYADVRFLKNETPSQVLMEKMNVDPKYQQWLRIVDTLDQCLLIHYLTPTEDVAEHDEIMSAVGHVRGIIFYKDNDTENQVSYVMICKSLPYTPEIQMDDETNYDELEKRYPLSMYAQYHAWEGTVIRLFYHKDEWYIATHRKIDAYNSFVSPQSFGELFEDVLSSLNMEKNFVDDLDKDCVYSFVMVHPNNTIILADNTGNSKGLLLAHVFNKQTNTFDNVYNYKTVLPNVSYPHKVSEETLGCQSITFRNIAMSLNEHEDTRTACGVLLSNGNTMVKLVSKQYGQLKQLRGNNPSVGHRYVELRQRNQHVLLEQWFSDEISKQRIDHMKQKYENLITRIHKWYISRFINKIIRDTPKEEFVTIQKCHAWYKNAKQNNPAAQVTRQVVEQVLSEAPYHCVLRMLNRTE